MNQEMQIRILKPKNPKICYIVKNTHLYAFMYTVDFEAQQLLFQGCVYYEPNVKIESLSKSTLKRIRRDIGRTARSRYNKRVLSYVMPLEGITGFNYYQYRRLEKMLVQLWVNNNVSGSVYLYNDPVRTQKVLANVVKSELTLKEMEDHKNYLRRQYIKKVLREANIKLSELKI